MTSMDIRKSAIGRVRDGMPALCSASKICIRNLHQKFV